jgi:predicted kinase
MCGLPFAGKSTAARALQLRTYAEAYRRVAHHLENGQVVIFDHGNFTRKERDEVRDIARRTGSQVRFIYVPVSADEARHRWLHNRETHQRYDVRDDALAG